MSLAADVILWIKKHNVTWADTGLGLVLSSFTVFFAFGILREFNVELNRTYGVILLLVWLGVFCLYLFVAVPRHTAKKKKRVQSLESLREALQSIGDSLGTNASSNVDENTVSLRFEQDGTVFDGNIETKEYKETESYILTIEFFVPSVQKKFYIEPKSFLSGEYADYVRFTDVSLENYYLHSTDADFLKQILADNIIIKFLRSYPTEFSNQVKTRFDEGQFQIRWNYGDHLQSEDKCQILADSFRALTMTAMRFSEQIKSKI